MPLRRILSTVLLLAFAMAMTVAAQTEAPSAATPKTDTAASADVKVPEGGMPHFVKPETPEQRKERLGTTDDPGIDPDPKQQWFRFGRMYTIQKFDKKWVRYTDNPQFVKTHPAVNIVDELYQENEKWVWAWIPVPKPRRTAEERHEDTKYKEYSETAISYLKKIRNEYEPLDPPHSSTHLRFEESSNGLPTSGSWRNSLAVADMNADGFADLVVPSQRGSASGTPSIFLGDGKGSWTRWNVKWPYRVDYGSVAVADFNQDKHMDVVFGIHLKGLAIFYGDGKGNFREVARETRFPTRRVLATDVDNDGWTDVVALWEGPLARGKDLRGNGYAGLRAYLNRQSGKSFEGVNLSDRRQGISGDWLAAANFNGDARPDFVGSTMFFNATQTVFLSEGAKGAQYDLLDDPEALIIPARGTYHAVTAGKFSSKSLDDAVVASVRRWPEKLDPRILPLPPLERVVSIDRISFAGGSAKRTPVMRFKPGRSISGMSRGDFDRDGNEDLIFTRHDPREAVLLLGDGKGGFSRATIEGLTLAPERNYDLTVADVNGDSRPDVIVMYEAASTTALSTKNGRIQVFLNRETTKGTVAAAAK